MYLLQPPSELQCNPYQLNDLTGAYKYSISLQCAIAQHKESVGDDSKIQWMQLVQELPRRIIEQIGDNPYGQSKSDDRVGEFFIFQSVLRISEMSPPDTSHTYWCELHSPGDELRYANFSQFANRLTIHGPDMYSSFPPCPPELPLHLAESVCVNSSSQLDEVISPTSPCSSDSEDCDVSTTNPGSDNSDDDPTSVVVIAVAAVAVVVVVILLGVIGTLGVCLCLKRKSSRNRDIHKEMSKEINIPTVKKLYIANISVKCMRYIQSVFTRWIAQVGYVEQKFIIEILHFVFQRKKLYYSTIQTVFINKRVLF